MSESSIILELQSLATNRQNDITDLLRKALLVATKLKLDDFKQWINNELHGYREDDVPEYRKTSSRLSFKNPYHGLIPIVLPDQELTDMLTYVDIRDPIESLDNLVKSDSSESNYLIYPLSQSEETFLLKIQNTHSKLPAVRQIGRNQVSAVIDMVRTTILEWALQLESEGIIGNGISFSENERQKAMTSSNINIQNFQGVLGDVKDSNVNQSHNNISVSTNDFESLANHLQEQGVVKEDLEKLELAIKNDPEQPISGKLGNNVSEWIGKMVVKASNGGWAVGIGAAGNILGTAISTYYGL